ncbi:MAG: sugar phosphorylase [Candidatus Omnitrophica bacterium]|nr:sugar phosphorylase [Candidatus Omnitrophota bacterium]
MERLAMLVGRYGVGVDFPRFELPWDQRASLLITYGDMVQKDGGQDHPEKPLVVLKRFLDDHLKGAVSAIHILPFFPSSSDDGFSVIDYKQVDPELGSWDDIRSIAESFRMMFDLVLNHVSSQCAWHRDYLNGIAPGRHYFIEVDPETNLDSVVRPRTSPLLTPVQTPAGLRHVWTTFSSDQIDLNFANPDVLFEFLDILMFFITQGVRVVRLDAIAYLWKELNTSCVHLPQTHAIVKLFRDFLEMLAPQVLILTETNVPHEENVSYFGDGDEAQIVYQFSLPPLLLHTLLKGSAASLTQWARDLKDPPAGCAFLNFTASHDGIGVRPLEGLLPAEEFGSLIESVHHRGGFVSTKTNPDGGESPYELNITYFDALSEPGRPDWPLHAQRFLCSQIIPLGLKGIPALYFHSLTATRNDYAAVNRTGQVRSINRRKWSESELLEILHDPKSTAAHVFGELARLLRLRAEHPAFHPDGGQQIFELGDAFFAFQRISPDESEAIISISNVTAERKSAPIFGRIPLLDQRGECVDLIRNETRPLKKGKLMLAPYQTVWLIPR